MIRLQNRGDTIVEVMLAIALLSAILFSSWGIVNRSTQIGLVARQRVEMVNYLKEQAEILQNRRDANPATFKSSITTQGSVVTASTLTPSSINENACSNAQMSQVSPPPVPATHFHHQLDSETGVLTKSPGYKEVNSLGGMARVWVQYVDHGAYIDFYVRGCWQTVGGQQREDMSQFVLRLNV